MYLYPEFSKSDTGISQSEIARRRAVEEVINKAIPSPYLLVEYQDLSLSASQSLATDKIFDIVLQGDQNKDAE